MKKSPEEHLAEAKYWLEGAKKVYNKLDVGQFVSMCRQCLEASGHPPEAIGTSEAKLEELTKLGHKACAVHFLYQIKREADGDNSLQVIDGYIQLLLQHQEKSGFTLDDVGTSLKQLEKYIDNANE